MFDGTKSGAYREDDPVAPLGVYGQSKEAGDRAVREGLVRARDPAHRLGLQRARPQFRQDDAAAGGRAAVLRVVARPDRLADQRRRHRRRDRRRSCSSWRPGTRRWGTYNFTGDGAVTWHGFAEAMFERRRALARPAAAGRGDHDRRLSDAGRPPSQFRARLHEDRRGVRHPATPWREALAEVIEELMTVAQNPDRLPPRSSLRLAGEG